MTATAARSRVIQNYIGGRFTDAGGADTLDVKNCAKGFLRAATCSRAR